MVEVLIKYESITLKVFFPNKEPARIFADFTNKAVLDARKPGGQYVSSNSEPHPDILKGLNAEGFYYCNLDKGISPGARYSYAYHVRSNFVGSNFVGSSDLKTPDEAFEALRKAYYLMLLAASRGISVSVAVGSITPTDPLTSPSTSSVAALTNQTLEARD